jgi:large subunit ribosomal protein L23
MIRFIKKVVVTEKSSHLLNLNKYVFHVNISANKIQLKNYIESSFNVKVSSINIIRNKGKKKRRGKLIGFTSDFKKAIVSIQNGSIENVKGMF